MAGSTRSGDCGKRKTQATLTYAEKKIHRKKLAETVEKRSEAWLTPNNATMSSFIQMLTVNEEDNSDPVNENNMEINPRHSWKILGM